MTTEFAFYLLHKRLRILGAVIVRDVGGWLWKQIFDRR